MNKAYCQSSGFDEIPLASINLPRELLTKGLDPFFQYVGTMAAAWQQEVACGTEPDTSQLVRLRIDLFLYRSRYMESNRGLHDVQGMIWILLLLSIVVDL